MEEAIADHVIGLLGSLAAKELDLLRNFQDDLETMNRKMAGIRAVLHDAEKKATKTKAISNWLDKLKDVLLDADDLFDAYLADELAREVMTKGKMVKEVRTFFSKSNRIVCAHKMGRKFRAIFKELDEIHKEKNQFMLNESSSSTSNESHEWRRTDPFVSEQDVVGRDEERKHLVSTLLNPDVKSDVSVVPMVGIGGSGKTTLAQLVYKDVSGKNHFELMMWVCVSDETHALSINTLAQKIIDELPTSAQTHQPVETLSRKIEEKCFLLVLDDVWNIKDRGEWLKLQNLFRGGRKGSMIIVTTRIMEVANTMGTDPPFHLKGLDEDKSWELFCRVAFRDGKEPDDQEELVDIGKDIVRKCAGVPLAIRTIGSLLFTKGLEVSEWFYIRDQELANIEELANIGSDDNKNKKILSILKLSYDHLPSHLKNCFAFCSLFPKDYEIERKVLIQMWIAEGFIQPLGTNRVLEDVGKEYFMQLLSRCLFQDVRRDSLGEIVQCKMHDLIHDLALSITKNECYIVKSERIEEENIGDGIRHLSSHFDGVWEFQFGNVKTKRVRTILLPKGKCSFIRSRSLSRFLNPIFQSTTSLPKHLRVLVLTNEQLEILESIGDLKHLRYLDLSWNSRLRKLPRGITKLHNLLSLRLNMCSSLTKLPRDMKRLVKLRHLELDDCFSLRRMPLGLGSLTNLQTLTTFVVDKRNGGGVRISELCKLNWLRGGLTIENLERQRSNIEEVKSSKFLRHMKYLETLSLKWLLYSLNEEESREDDELKDEMILEALEPPHTIKLLEIDGFQSKCLSKSIGSLTSLQKLYLYSCPSLASLPESIGSLTSLQELRLDECTSLTSLPESIGSLTSLQELSLNECTSLTSLPESIGSLTSLQRLSLYGCTSLTSLPESIGSLTSLQELNLHGCTSLASIPESIGSLTSLQELSLHECTSLASLPESIGSLTSLQRLSLRGCTSLASLPESIGSLTSLQRLSLHECTSLASLPESIGSLTSLQRLSLHECTSLASLPESIGSLTSLQELRLDECTSLTSLPKSIGSLTSLQALSPYKCTSLTSLPESIGSLTSLQRLSLYGCTSLTSLPESIGSFTSLQELSLHGCTSLASIPESIGSLTSLQELSLHGCTSLTSLPESIGSLTSLQGLSLHECTSLASLPESIGSLTSLQGLSLHECTSLASLPKSIGSLTSLQGLSLYECTSLASLPESIGSLTSLQRLSLYECTSLTSLPESIGSLTSLHELRLHKCTSLASLPEVIGNLTLLQVLVLRNCLALTSLPNSIKSLTSLQHLVIRRCSALMERYGQQLKRFNWPGLVHIQKVEIC
ncbi:hypothetical protein QN277_002184 [Acacia crassicarpa]|uniref:Uncharacterized protein n=1 Tax=Acacia crassicarpa TaxID=499986 RepID=A0AAE1N8Y9_9FABA|nr:hypothetical protein QN277_002184 [Acacia crassicarpa]